MSIWNPWTNPRGTQKMCKPGREESMSGTFINFGNSKTVLTITADGRVMPGEGYTPTEAGAAAMVAMQEVLTGILDARAAVEREECAAMVEAAGMTYMAAAIRARGNPAA